MNDTQTKTKYETLLDAYNEAQARLRDATVALATSQGGPESAERSAHFFATIEVRDAQDALRQYMQTAVALRAADERDEN